MPFRLTLILLLAAPLAGCRASYNESLDPVVGRLRDGQYDRAANLVSAFADDVDGPLDGQPRPPRLDSIPLRLEEGACHFYAGHTGRAVAAFERAEDVLEYYDQQPAVRLTDEAGAALTNLSFLPYRGTQGDRILAAAYRTLALLDAGETGQAGRAARLIANRQTEAADRFAGEIAAENKAIEQEFDRRRLDADVSRAGDSPAVERAYDARSGPLADARGYTLGGEGRFLNPFAEHVAGLYYHAAGDDDTAGAAFARVDRMLPPDLPRRQIELYRALAAGELGGPTTHVIFAEGFCPRIEEFRLDLPLIVVTGRLSSYNLALPYLVPQPPSAPYLSVFAGDVREETEVVADMDEVLAAEFNARRPGVVGKSVALSIFKSGLAAGAQYAGRQSDDPNVDAAVQIATLIWLTASNQADLRTWRTLPKTYQIAQVPTPPDGRVTIRVPGEPPLDVDVPPGVRDTIVFVRHTAPGVAPAVRVIPILPQ